MFDNRARRKAAEFRVGRVPPLVADRGQAGDFPGEEIANRQRLRYDLALDGLGPLDARPDEIADEVVIDHIFVSAEAGEAEGVRIRIECRRAFLLPAPLVGPMLQVAVDQFAAGQQHFPGSLTGQIVPRRHQPTDVHAANLFNAGTLIETRVAQRNFFLVSRGVLGPFRIERHAPAGTANPFQDRLAVQDFACVELRTGARSRRRTSAVDSQLMT